MDDGGKAAWILATVLGFWVFWPIGIALVLFLAVTGRLRAWRRERWGRWYNMANGPQGAAPEGRGWASGGCGMGWGRWNQAPQQGPVSGNRAFDEYRSETLRRLEDEQKEFVDYLERLRQAKDKSEFDQFMADRRRGAVVPEAPHGG